MSLKFSIIIAFLLFCSYSFSQTCCSIGILLSNNIGLPNFGKRTFKIDVNYDYNNLNILNNGKNN